MSRSRYDLRYKYKTANAVQTIFRLHWKQWLSFFSNGIWSSKLKDNPIYNIYLDLHLEIDGKRTIYDKHDDLPFPIVNFPFIYGSNPSVHGNRVFIPQLIRHSRACRTTRTFCTVIDFFRLGFWNRVMWLYKIEVITREVLCS